MTSQEMIELIEEKRLRARNLCDDYSGLSTDEVLEVIVNEIRERIA